MFHYRFPRDKDHSANSEVFQDKMALFLNLIFFNMDLHSVICYILDMRFIDIQLLNMFFVIVFVYIKYYRFQIHAFERLYQGLRLLAWHYKHVYMYK